MKKKDIEKFKKMLEERRRTIVQIAEAAREEGMGVEQADLADEVDQASSETGHAMNMRLRDRELILLKKIDKALAKIAKDEFGICTRCGEDIAVKRLEARPVAEMCINCKEELEKVERGYTD